MSVFTKSFAKILTVLGILIIPSAAFATTYECHPQQVFVWKHGILKSVPRNTIKEVYRFDDETAVLWLATSPSVPFGPTQFQIMQKMSPDNDLIAMATLGDTVHFIGNETLTIRSWDKNSGGLIFLLTDSDGASSGHCKESPTNAGEQNFKPTWREK